jgi:hypothetical protein
MASLNRTDRLTLDAFSDPLLSGPVYSRFTNRLKNPLLGVKGVQMVNLNTINCSLPLNDDNGQLMLFFYVGGSAAATRSLANLKCVRLLPSWFIEQQGYTTFTRNQYFTSGADLVAALNTAASTGGDDTVYNPRWSSNQVVFGWNSTTRRVTITSANTNFIGMAAADDPNVLDLLRGTSNANNRIRMPDVNSYSYSTATLQPYVEGITMNARIGFPLKYAQQGVFYGPSSFPGIATNSGIPYSQASGTIIADTPPILLGVQNIGVYLSIVTGGGTDSKGRKNLIGTVPMEAAPYAVQSYTMCSVEVPSLSTANEIYEITVELLCPETGLPYNVWSGANTQVGLTLTY